MGNLVANAQMDIGYGYQLLYTNQTFSGMSGGPITNIKGELIGIHGRVRSILRERAMMLSVSRQELIREYL